MYYSTWMVTRKFVHDVYMYLVHPADSLNDDSMY